MKDDEYQGFQLMSPHSCERKLPDPYEFHDKHPGQALVCRYCTAKWVVNGTASPQRGLTSDHWNWTRWWVQYEGIVE